MAQPLLMDELQSVERVSLSALKQHPGYAVLEKLFMAACKRATDDVIKLDPAADGYERKLVALQSKARERNEFSLLILQSIAWQIDLESKKTEETKNEPGVNRIVKGLKQ